ncbi:MAG: NUDIX domain-containing protein [Leptospiraceae bacterium]|nr:NUDIX domain-containing protein [Leptospiraceae bacterium]
MNEIYSFCSYCGNKFPKKEFPKECISCKNITYRNPIPVAVIIVPVDSGVLLVRRGIEPGKGHLALPGGFIDYGENWREAGAREVFEELCVRIDPRKISEFKVESSTDGRLVLIFGIAEKITMDSLGVFEVSEEALERVIQNTPIELVFPHHTIALRDYFKKKENSDDLTSH